MHILFLTDNFPPEVNAPSSRTFEHCRQWVKCGHRVSVITCAPNFPQGKVYRGYRNSLCQREMMDGIHVMRVWSYIAPNQGVARRVIDYISFMLSAVIASPLVRRPDLVISTSPQFFTALAGFIVGIMKRVPFVFELRDLWPESIKAVGVMGDSVLLRFLERMEIFLYKKAAMIISVTHSFKDNLAQRGVDIQKIRVVTNGVDVERFRPRSRDSALLLKHDLEGKFVAGYVGTHGLAHNLETVLDAAHGIRQLAGGDLFRFIMLGNGARKDAIMTRAEAMGLDNVIFLDSVPKKDVVRYWSLLDVSITHLRKTTLFSTVIPSKLFESMGMGIPVIHGVSGESSEIVKKTGAGLIFEPENSDDLACKLIRLSRDPELRFRMRENCLRGADLYNRSQLANKMLGYLKRVSTKTRYGIS